MSSVTYKSGEGAKHGSILILVLWVLFFLAALTVAIGTHVTARMMVGQRMWSRMESRTIAEAGAQLALSEAVQHTQATNAWDGITKAAWNRGEDVFSERELGQNACSVFFHTVEDNGVTVTNIGIVGEDGKLNVNTAGDEIMARALVNLITSVGKRSASQADLIVSSIQHWIGVTDEMLTEGDESGYYAHLSPQYTSRNAPMESMAELRMVNGMDGELYARLVPHVTVYGSGNVNLNCASEPVLVALAQAAAGEDVELGVCRSLAEKIVEFQVKLGFRTEDDIRRPPEGLDLKQDERVLFSNIPAGNLDLKSTAFRGVSCGADEDSDTSDVSVEFVCDVREGRFVHWREY